jgi:hypothetical protein
MEYRSSFLSVLAFAAVTALGFAVMYGRQRSSTIPAPAADGAIALVSSDFHNFGVILPESSVSHEFLTFNPLPQAIHLDDIRRSCSCTKAILNGRDLQPGEKFSLTCQLSSQSFEETIGSTVAVLGHTATSRISFQYNLQATVLRLLKAAHATAEEDIDLGPFLISELPAQPSVQLVRGKYPLAYDQVNVESTSPDITAVARPETADSWTLAFTIARQNVLGPIGVPMTFTFLDHGKPLGVAENQQVYLELRGPVLATPPSLYLSLGPGEKVERRLDITARLPDPATEPPEVESVRCDSKNGMARLDQTGGRNWIVLDYTAGSGGVDRGRIIASVRYGGSSYDVGISYLAVIGRQADR